MSEWRSIAGLEGRYEVSDGGAIRNARTRYILKPRFDKDGYALVTLWNPKAVTCKVHRVVAVAFLPNPLAHVNHINCVRNDNRVENLEWATPAMNVKHTRDSGNYKNVTGRAIEGVCVASGEAVRFSSFLEAERFGFNRNRIYDVMKGVQKKHRNRTWRYV